MQESCKTSPIQSAAYETLRNVVLSARSTSVYTSVVKEKFNAENKLEEFSDPFQHEGLFGEAEPHRRVSSLQRDEIDDYGVCMVESVIR